MFCSLYDDNKTQFMYGEENETFYFSVSCDTNKTAIKELQLKCRDIKDRIKTILTCLQVG